MNKQTSAKQAVDLTGSRIRRAPRPEPRQATRRSSEEELVFGITGVMLTAVALAAVVIGIGVVTAFRAVTAQPEPFRQCYSAGGADCVVDGDTIFVDRQRVDIAGMVAPRIHDAACPAEHKRGVAAAVALSALLQSGEVTIGAPVQEPGRGEVRPVQVDGNDVAKRMIALRDARSVGNDRGWCS